MNIQTFNVVLIIGLLFFFGYEFKIIEKVVGQMENALMQSASQATTPAPYNPSEGIL
jgi:hypothetical protein